MYNKAIIGGRLTADPELKQTPNGVAVTTFSVAVNRAYKSADGQRQADFLDIVAWRGTAEFICRYFSRGKAILLEGKIQTRAYVDKNGQNRRAWEIVADSAHFVESKNAAQNSAGGTFQNYGELQERGQTASSAGGADDFAELDDDDDLPF